MLTRPVSASTRVLHLIIGWRAHIKLMSTRTFTQALRQSCDPAFDYSALAQLVEQMTVNHWVAGSSPAGGPLNLLRPAGVFNTLENETNIPFTNNATFHSDFV